MVNLTIDGINVSVPEGTTIMDAAKEAGIYIPHLCYLKGINEISACKVCMVEIQGKQKMVTACSTKVSEGLVIFTSSPRVRKIRRTNVELILSQHDCNCVTCVRSGNCSLQTIAGHLGIYDIPFEKQVPNVPWDNDFPLIRDASKCIKCMRCVQICDKVQRLNVWDVQNSGSYTTISTTDNTPIDCTDCSLCGQCITHCPVGALKERNDIPKIYDALADPEKITVVQIAPAVRTAWLERVGMPEGIDTEGRLVAALKKLGFDYVLDTSFAADVTIMEEGSELIERLPEIREKKLPMFTSCCPGWVSFVTKKHPELLGRLSTTKSPQQIFGAIIKTYFAEKTGVDPKNIISISIMPCVSKKREAALESMKRDGISDVDIVLTTRELVRLLRADRIDPTTLTDAPFDNPLGDGTGAGVIFGATGGVLEAALRSAHYLVTGREASPGAFKAVRPEKDEYPDASGNSNVMEEGSAGATEKTAVRKENIFNIGDVALRTCVVSGLGNAEDLIRDILSGRAEYDFVEVMACPGGCVGGGGQPIHDNEEWGYGRSKKLYELDTDRTLRRSHENPLVKQLYDEFLDKPLSEKSEELLHSDHIKENNYK